MLDAIEGTTVKLIVFVIRVLLNQLQLTLETLSMEQLALASLIRPLTSQLINSHFTLDGGSSELENELIALIRKQLKDSL